MSDEGGRDGDAVAQAVTVERAFEVMPMRQLISEFAVDTMDRGWRGQTGFLDLDYLTGGLTPGELWVISGRSGVGKSVLVSDLIRTTAVQHGHATLLITRSGAPEQLVQRLLAAEGKVALQHMKSGLSDDEGAQLRKTMDKLVEVPLVMAQTHTLDVAEITALVVSQQEEHPLLLLLVDDVPAGPAQVHMLAELRELAAKHQVGVVAVVQEDVDDSERQLRRIEQIADVALTVHRDDQDDFHSPRSGEADFIITRHRNGPIAKIVVYFQGQYGRFVDPHLPRRL